MLKSQKQLNKCSKDELTGQLIALGVKKGDILLVHTSFRAIKPVEDGPKGLIEALINTIGSEGTLVMPSWTGNDEEPFNPMITPAAKDLGILADIFWRMPNVKRSNHPFAFAAKGPRATKIISDPLPLPPHIPKSPVGRVYDMNGKVLLLGVNHDANTMIHLAELSQMFRTV